MPPSTFQKLAAMLNLGSQLISVTCVAGTYKTADTGECTECPADTISTEGADSCLPCENGTIADAGKTMCGTWRLVKNNLLLSLFL